MADCSQIEEGHPLQTAKLPRIDQLKSLIWIQTSFLGDIILQTAALRFIQLHYPSIQQWVITTPVGSKALAGHPAIHKLIVFDKRGRSMRKAVQQVKAELQDCSRSQTVLLQAHRSFRSSLLAFSLGFPTITYDESQGSFLADVTVPRVAVLHEAQRIGLLLEPLGVGRDRLCEARPYLQPGSPDSVSQRFGLPTQDRLIAMAPGSVWGTKRWPIEHFIELARLLLQKTTATLIILGSGDEEAAARSISDALADPRVINLAGKTKLDELLGLYPLIDLLISNDSSPLHYASAFDRPTLALFGATVPALGFGPLASRSQVAEVELVCRPCSDHGPQVCPLGHFKCMRTLSPERVLSLALALLE